MALEIRRISLMQTAGHDSDRTSFFPYRGRLIEIYTLYSRETARRIVFWSQERARSKRIELCTSVFAKLSPIQHFARLYQDQHQTSSLKKRVERSPKRNKFARVDEDELTQTKEKKSSWKKKKKIWKRWMDQSRRWKQRISASPLYFFFFCGE
jgi:hypothetical protein